MKVYHQTLKPPTVVWEGHAASAGAFVDQMGKAAGLSPSWLGGVGLGQQWAGWLGAVVFSLGGLQQFGCCPAETEACQVQLPRCSLLVHPLLRSLNDEG